jgi:hypothetical protein
LVVGFALLRDLNPTCATILSRIASGRVRAPRNVARKKPSIG